LQWLDILDFSCQLGSDWAASLNAVLAVLTTRFDCLMLS
jgi:hypothetical protein